MRAAFEEGYMAAMDDVHTAANCPEMPPEYTIRMVVGGYIVENLTTEVESIHTDLGSVVEHIADGYGVPYFKF